MSLFVDLYPNDDLNKVLCPKEGRASRGGQKPLGGEGDEGGAGEALLAVCGHGQVIPADFLLAEFGGRGGGGEGDVLNVGRHGPEEMIFSVRVAPRGALQGEGARGCYWLRSGTPSPGGQTGRQPVSLISGLGDCETC